MAEYQVDLVASVVLGVSSTSGRIHEKAGCHSRISAMVVVCECRSCQKVICWSVSRERQITPTVNIRGSPIQVQIIQISFPRIRDLLHPLTSSSVTSRQPSRQQYLPLLLATRSFCSFFLSTHLRPSQAPRIPPSSVVFDLSIEVLDQVHRRPGDLTDNINHISLFFMDY